MRWIADERQIFTQLLRLTLAVARQHQDPWAQLIQTGVEYPEVDPLAATPVAVRVKIEQVDPVLEVTNDVDRVGGEYARVPRRVDGAPRLVAAYRHADQLSAVYTAPGPTEAPALDMNVFPRKPQRRWWFAGERWR